MRVLVLFLAALICLPATFADIPCTSGYKLCFFRESSTILGNLLCGTAPKLVSLASPINLADVIKEFDCVPKNNFTVGKFEHLNRPLDLNETNGVKVHCCGDPLVQSDWRQYLLILHRNSWQFELDAEFTLYPYNNDKVRFSVEPIGGFGQSAKESNLAITNFTVQFFYGKNYRKMVVNDTRFSLPLSGSYETVTEVINNRSTVELCTENIWLNVSSCVRRTVSNAESVVVPVEIQTEEVKVTSSSVTVCWMLNSELLSYEEVIVDLTDFEVSCQDTKFRYPPVYQQARPSYKCTDYQPLKNLRAATEYNCSVISNFRGSKKTGIRSIVVHTLVDMPSVNPQVEAGVYESIEAGNAKCPGPKGTRCVNLYYRIDQELTNGPLQNTNITIYNLDHQEAPKFLSEPFVEGRPWYRLLGLFTNSTYLVSLCSQTSAGCNRAINHTQVKIQAHWYADWETTSLVLHRQNQTVQLIWNNSTVLQSTAMCNVAVLRTNGYEQEVWWSNSSPCQNPMQFSLLGITDWLHDLQPLEIAYSVTSDNQSSGLRWIDCVFVSSSPETNAVKLDWQVGTHHVSLTGSLPSCGLRWQGWVEQVALRYHNGSQQVVGLCAVADRSKDGTPFSCTVHSLTPGTQYEFSVELLTGDRNRLPIPPLVVTTLQVPNWTVIVVAIVCFVVMILVIVFQLVKFAIKRYRNGKLTELRKQQQGRIRPLQIKDTCTYSRTRPFSVMNTQVDEDDQDQR